MAKGGFPGMGGGNMQQLVRQAQKMQQDMQRLQEELKTREFPFSAGGGVVTATATGERELKSLHIAPEAIDPDDPEMLEDLVLAAVNGALRAAAETSEREMGRLTGNMNIGF